MSEPNPSILHSLSGVLASNINQAELEAKRSKEQLEALLFSKNLVDESLRALIGGGPYEAAAQFTIYPTGSMLLPMCELFNAAPAGVARNLISSQIQTSLQAGVSAFIVACPDEGQSGLEELRRHLATHKEELLSLEQRLTSRLSTYSPHLQTILHGSLESFRDSANPARFVNTGNLLRELQREFLAVVAPDNEVKKAPWFVADPTSKSGVTRRHRIEYAIFGNLTKAKFPKAFAEQADQTASELLKDIGKLSELTHVTEAVLEKTYAEATPLFTAVMQRFLLLIAAIESSRMLVQEDIAAELQSHLDDIFTGDFFDELDCLSSHTRPQGVSDVEVTEVTFDEDWIDFGGNGSVDCELQYGSDGDVRRGDGVEWVNSFPFTFAGRVPIADLAAIEIDRESISIDTSSFFEDEPDE
ncbi:MAG: hypothetical protein BGO12_13445 [Verrucomicrobia bacterium 61-8]|nr:hypothetical protein [Verrucomicrobiota bacterium]OJV22383.1 MAG: hypothetical protein BGO12_13445 [Verrucomicrobia bacterium 61-8]